jgi:hypothetical protein
MSIEDRVRQLLTDAVANEPPLRGAPLDYVLRRRRRRPLVAGAVALTLVLAAVVGLAAVQARQRPLPSTISTKGWKTYTDPNGNLRFRYPPDWRLQLKEGFGWRGSRLATLVPPGIAIPPKEQPRFSVEVAAGPLFWIGEDWFGITSLGRLPGGQSYLRRASDPTDTSGWLRPPPPPPAVIDRGRDASWSIDWGRPCFGGDARCVPHSVHVRLQAANGRLWDRYRAVAETIPTTLEQLRPTKPSVGDRGLPACRPDQWRLIWPKEYGGAHWPQATAIQGGVQYRQGPRCHLRLTVRMAVEDRGGRRLPVKGNPARIAVEGDLPLDGMQRHSGSWVIGGALMWHFIWDEWCNRGLPRATLRVTADGGARLTVPGLDPTRYKSPRLLNMSCKDRGRPSVIAGWP